MTNSTTITLNELDLALAQCVLSVLDSDYPEEQIRIGVGALLALGEMLGSDYVQTMQDKGVYK